MGGWGERLVLFLTYDNSFTPSSFLVVGLLCLALFSAVHHCRLFWIPSTFKATFLPRLLPPSLQKGARKSGVSFFFVFCFNFYFPGQINLGPLSFFSRA